MYVNRMHFQNVKVLNCDIPIDGSSLPEAARKRLLLQGANGSGKSTVLDAIRTLWTFFGRWLDVRGSAVPDRHLSHYLAETDLAAIEIQGVLDAQPLWIGMGKRTFWREFKEAHPDAAFAGLIGGMGGWEIELPAADLLERRQRSLAGSEPFVNVVYFPPEGRIIRVARNPGEHRKQHAEVIDTTKFNWTAVYDPAISLESILVTVKALSDERFKECLELVNLALAHRNKRIIGFGPKGRLVVEGKTEAGIGYEHFIEDLSSGEQQVLILVSFIIAFLRPGGIVLLDEPDLHMHISMVKQLLQTLDYVCQQRQAQLIVTSHSERVWDFFGRQDEQIELDGWGGPQP